MPYDDRLTSEALLRALAALAQAGNDFVSSQQLTDTTGSSLSAVKRMLSRLVEQGQVEVTGRARATRYRLPTTGSTWPICNPLKMGTNA